MTPIGIAREMCMRIRRPPSEWIVLDPACGDGNLLLAAAETMVAAGVENSHKRLIGVDVDPVMVQQARLRLSEALHCHAEDVRILCADFCTASDNLSLFSAVFDTHEPNV